MMLSDRVRASRAVPLSEGPNARIRAFAAVAPMPSADVPTVAEVRDSDHAAVLADRNALLDAYRSLVVWAGYNLAAMPASELADTLKVLRIDLPLAAVDDVLWSLHDARAELKCERTKAQKVAA